MTKKIYSFGEKEKEYSKKDNAEIPVWKSPKYETAKKKVIEMLESDTYKDVLDESDFWILMNRTNSGKMAYTGLIISHNGCLKINDTLPRELKFNPRCMYYVEPNEELSTYNNSLIFVYDSSRINSLVDEAIEDKQMIFEIGEVSAKNCTNDYPYAMALKRCMDRVILKNSKLAYSGVYSDSEAEEFADKQENEETEKAKFIPATEKQLTMIKTIFENRVDELMSILKELGKTKIVELSIKEASDIISNQDFSGNGWMKEQE